MIMELKANINFKSEVKDASYYSRVKIFEDSVKEDLRFIKRDFFRDMKLKVVEVGVDINTTKFAIKYGKLWLCNDMLFRSL